MEEIIELAQHIHDRRRRIQNNASPVQAGAEALLASAYGLEIDLDSFKTGGQIRFRDASGKKVTVVGSESDPIEVAPILLSEYDVIILAVGSSIDDLDIVGWSWEQSISNAPIMDNRYLVGSEFCIEMPDEFDFPTPNLDIPKVWSHSKQGWWTPLGFYVYDRQAEHTVFGLREKLAG